MFWPVILPPVHFGVLFPYWKKLIGYDADSTLTAVMPSQGIRITVAESLMRDLGRVSEGCDLWEMKFNASKKKTLIVSSHPHLLLAELY